MPLGSDDQDEFAYMANHYRLEGLPPVQLCQWNRDVAAMCSRIDDARAWDFLLGLIQEFGSTNDDGMFNESVFSQAATIVPPRPPSPHGLEERRASDETINAGAFPGVPLSRGGDIASTTPEPAGSDNGSGSSDSEGPLTPQRSRFKSFVPPTNGEGGRSNINRFASSGSSLLAASGIMRHGKKLGFETPLSEDDSLTPIADMDFPDPYGISAALDAMGQQPKAKAALASRSSRSTPQSTRPSSPSRGDRSTTANGRRSATGSARGSQRPSITDRTADRIQPSLISRRVQDAFPLEQWDEYRDSRCKSFLDWWQAYVNDVS